MFGFLNGGKYVQNLITIIVPIYQSEKTLNKCIDSILNQSYTNIEIILVNDGSSDKSGAICDEFASKDNRIKVIHKENSGVSSARNVGLDNAKGDFIQFVDSDDWLDKDACSILLKEIKDQKVDLVICGLNITKNGKLIRTPHLSRNNVSPSNHFDDLKFIYPIFASPCNKLYKREMIGRFNESLSAGEDLLFNFDYIRNTNSVQTIESCLYNVSLDNQGSLNRRFRENQLDLLLNLEEEKRKFCVSQYGDKFDQHFINNSIILSTHGYLRKIVKLKPRGISLSIIKKYSNHQIIKPAAQNAKLANSDKRFFNYLLKNKNIYGMYVFFRLKTKLR